MITKQKIKNQKLTASSKQTKAGPDRSLQSKALLTVRESAYKRLFQTALDGLLILDADTGKVKDVNPFFLQMTGYDRKEILAKKLWETGAFKGIKAFRDAFSELKTKKYIRFDNLLLGKKNGEDIKIEFKCNVFSVGSERVVQCNIRDITERKKLEERIRLQAFHDPLTSLPNRLLLNERFKLEISQSKRSRKKVAILFLDLDHFKDINDTLGHATGDKLLRDAAVRLQACIRESDTVARIGGDEFNIMLCNIALSEETAIIAHNILDSLDKPFIVDGHTLHVTTSIGISIYPDDSIHIDELMKNADMAMYDAKENGRNTYRFFNAEMNIRAHKRMELENNLRNSVKRGELSAYYQPYINMDTHKVSTVEALVRWQNPKKGMFYPVQFLPLAEEKNIIQSIDLWMLHTACSQNKLWQNAGFPPLCVSNNISSKLFQQPDFVDLVRGVLKETKLNPRYLNIEITENTAIYDIDSTVRKIANLTKLGVGCSIDNFGTGYVSLSRLNKLPIQKIKIDHSFIRDIESESENRDIINAIITLAHNLKLKVVAEGVESSAQLAFLRSCKCDEIQGYIFSHALPAEECRMKITSNN
jgi:diguanylate cyclase (GGDEF)-like protein/PAS domain S-box-containing protein